METKSRNTAYQTPEVERLKLNNHLSILKNASYISTEVGVGEYEEEAEVTLW